MRILIIEDEISLAQLLKKGLEGEGYAVDYLTDGQSGLKRIELNYQDYDLLILDLMLPKMSGTEVCKAIRQMDIKIPIIILTAKSEVLSRVSLLDMGADDYMTKPFEFSELAARIRALTRRPKASLPNVLMVNGVSLDSNTRKVYLDGKEVILTLKEFRLLEYLMRRPNETIKRIDLLDNIWDFDFDSLSNIIDVYINRLRDKLDKNRKKKLIETIIGVGYRLNI